MPDLTALLTDAFPDSLPRGVFRSRVRTSAGHPIIFAVDRFGNLAGLRIVKGIATVEGAERMLWAELDERDPGPALVRDTPRVPQNAEPTPLRPEPMPAHVSLALWGRLTKRA